MTTTTTDDTPSEPIVTPAAIIEACRVLNFGVIIDPEHGPDQLGPEHLPDLIGALCAAADMLTIACVAPEPEQKEQFLHGYTSYTKRGTAQEAAEVLAVLASRAYLTAYTLDRLGGNGYAPLAAKAMELAADLTMHTSQLATDDPNAVVDTHAVAAMHKRLRNRLRHINGSLSAAERWLRDRGFAI